MQRIGGGRGKGGFGGGAAFGELRTRRALLVWVGREGGWVCASERGGETEREGKERNKIRRIFSLGDDMQK